MFTAFQRKPGNQFIYKTLKIFIELKAFRIKKKFTLLYVNFIMQLNFIFSESF